MPATGARWTYGSSTDTAMLTRGSGSSPRLSSTGGTASSTLPTTPSAGATTAPTEVGGTRFGARKNSASVPAATRDVRRAHPYRHPNTPNVSAPATNGRPAACMGGTTSLTSPQTCWGSERPTVITGDLAMVRTYSGIRHPPGQELLVGRKVELAGARDADEDHRRGALRGGFACLADRTGDGMVRLGRRHDALSAGEHHARLERLELADRDGVDHVLVVQVRDQRRHAVVAQAAGVDRVRYEVGAQRVHLQQRRQAARVAEVVAVLALRERRSGLRLARHDVGGGTALEVLPYVRDRDAAQVRPAAGAGKQVIGRLLVEQRELLDDFLPDDRLVQQHVVEHRAEGVVGVGGSSGDLDGLRDRHAQRPRRVGEPLAQLAARVRQLRRRRMHYCAERLL